MTGVQFVLLSLIKRNNMFTFRIISDEKCYHKNIDLIETYQIKGLIVSCFVILVLLLVSRLRWLIFDKQ